MPKQEKKSLSFSSVGELNKISEDVKLTINNAYQCKQYCKAANDIFRKADNFYKTLDEEQAYMLFMRYFYIVQNIKKSYEFVKSKNTYLTILKDCSTSSAITKAEELSKSLHSRYEKRNTELREQEEIERKLKIENENIKKSIEREHKNIGSKNESNTTLVLPEVPNGLIPKTDETSPHDADLSNISHDVKNSPIYPTKSFLSVTELYTLLKDYKDSLHLIMIIDIRPVDEYTASRVDHMCIINVPEHLLQQGANINSIERKLSKKTWEVWTSRFQKKIVIIMDDEFDNVNTMSPSLFLLQDVLCKFEGSYQVIMLIGGFKRWILHYPSMTTNPFYCRKPVMPTLLDATALLKDLTYPELISTEKKRNGHSMPQEKEPTNKFKDMPPQENAFISDIPSSISKFTKPHGISNNLINDADDVIAPGNTSMENANITNKQEFHFSDPDIKNNANTIPNNTPTFNPHTTHLPPKSSKSTPISSSGDVSTSTPADMRYLINRQDNNANTASGVNTVNTNSVTQNIKGNAQDNDKPTSTSISVNAIDISKTSNTLPSSSSFNSSTVNNTASIKNNLGTSMPASVLNSLNVVVTTSPTQSNTSSLTASFHNLPSTASSNISITSIPSVTSHHTILTNKHSSSIFPNNATVLPNVPPSTSPNTVSPSIPSVSPSIVPNASPSMKPNNSLSSIVANVSPSVLPSNVPSTIVPHSTIPTATISNSKNPTLPASNLTNRSGTSLEMSNHTEGLPINIASSNTLPINKNIQPVSAVVIPHSRISPGIGTSNTAPVSTVFPGSVVQPQISSVSSIPQVSSSKQDIPKSGNISPPQVSGVQNIGPSSQKSQQFPPNIPVNPQQAIKKPTQQGNLKQNFTTTYGLPHGWEKAVSHETGRIYYKDHNTQSTWWALPPEVLAQVQNSESHQSEDKGNKQASQLSNEDNNRPSLKRSLSSPNLADLVNNNESNINIEKSMPAKPVIDRSVKPQEQKQVLVDRTKKPISANRLQKLSPVYGSLGHALTGLKNLGNTCYMNSVIQCLSNTTPLSKYFTSGLYEPDLNTQNMNSHPGEIARELSFVIIVLSAGQYRSVSPLDFKIALGRFSQQFNGSQQQDSHELLMFLLDGLHEDINKVKCRQSIKEKGNDNLPDHTAADQAWADYLLNNDSIIVQLFQGQFRSTVVCLSCGNMSKTFDAFNCLQLELPSNRSSTLQDCITSFTKAEKIGGNDSWKCSKCKCYREASKTIEVWKLPPVLIIQLKRFRCDGRWRNKIQSAINFPVRNFNMGNHIVGPTSMISNYHLYAIINHYGSFESGHYTAYCENPVTGKWYCFDDNIVKELDSATIKTNAAYLLFYTAVDFKEYLTK